ncbi:hypothetical protein EDB19DRAFT_1835717 [Suillus lakei]|nr:hypothetical protein EDB19DRAFT_1835717 [Suillus lakei]
MFTTLVPIYWPVLALWGQPVTIHGCIPYDFHTGQYWTYGISRSQYTGQYWPYGISQSQSMAMASWSHATDVSLYYLHAGQYWSYEVGQLDMDMSLIVYLLASTGPMELAVLILQGRPPIINGFDTGQYWSYVSGRLISRDQRPGTCYSDAGQYMLYRPGRSQSTDISIITEVLASTGSMRLAGHLPPPAHTRMALQAGQYSTYMDLVQLASLQLHTLYGHLARPGYRFYVGS